MVVAGLHVHFDFFKGFLSFDERAKDWARVFDHAHMSAGVLPYLPLYNCGDTDNYFSPDYGNGFAWPLDPFRPYIGERSWIFPMMVLLGAGGVEGMHRGPACLAKIRLLTC